MMSAAASVIQSQECLRDKMTKRSFAGRSRVFQMGFYERMMCTRETSDQSSQRSVRFSRDVKQEA